MEEVAGLLNRMVKDLARVLALRETNAGEDDQIAALAQRYGLSDAWRRFMERFDEA